MKFFVGSAGVGRLLSNERKLQCHIPYSLTSVSAWPGGFAQDPRPGGQCEGARHAGHLRQLVLLLGCTGMPRPAKSKALTKYFL